MQQYINPTLLLRAAPFAKKTTNRPQLFRRSGAALDVFCTEPLPKESPLWEMDNVLLSPHNADMTATFLNDSVGLLVDNMSRFLAGEKASMHRVDTRAGY